MFNLNRLDGENEEQFIFRLGQAKDSGQLDMSWEELADIINHEFRESEDEYRTEAAYRKPYQQAKRFLESNVFKKYESYSSYSKELEKQKEDLRKERIKLQTMNVERNRIDRSQSRHELYYEYVGYVCDTLPLPDFQPLYAPEESNNENVKYLVTLADVHYGATFKSFNNEYSPTIAMDRLRKLCGDLIDFVNKKKIDEIYVASLGDMLQGLLRVSDLKINDSSVVKATVEISRLIASFLNELSAYVKVYYYHVPTANHTQTRPLGTKASELADEDLEYVISHYIEDLCVMNDRVFVNIADDESQFIEIPIWDYNIIAMHGHQLKNIDNSLRDLSMLCHKFIDFLVLGHFHNGKEIPCFETRSNDTEILISPSFIGSDPYSDSLMKGCKSSVKIYGFDKNDGHTETYKIILN